MKSIQITNVTIFNILRGYFAFVIYPFIFIKYSKNEYINSLNDKFNTKALNDNYDKMLNHEYIHIQQQLELLVIFYFIIYIINYIVNILKFNNHMKAYRNICFEKECYNNETNLNYLSIRPKFNWLKYI